MTFTPSGRRRRIEQASPIPYYHQLAEILRDEIDGARWDVGALIPTEGELIEMFGVSRSVTRKALDLLEGEGRVLRIKGKGTVVTRPKASFEAAATAARWFREGSASLRIGRMIGAERVTAGGYLGRLLEVEPGDDVWEIRLTHLDGETPFSYVEMYLRIEGTLTVTAPPRFEEGGPGIYKQLAEKYGVEVTRSELEIEVTSASSLVSDLLGIKRDAEVVQVSSLDFLSRGSVVGFTRSLVQTGAFFFAASIRHEEDAPRQVLEPERSAGTTD